VFGIQEFMNVVLGNIPEWYGPEVTWKALGTSTLQVILVLLLHKPSGVLSSKVKDLPPCVLADGWSRFTLGLRVILVLHGFSLDVKPHVILTLRMHRNHRSNWLDGSPSSKLNLSVPTI
jgi:hypothetical protein